MRTIKLQISYDGTRYAGWQIQPNGVSVQGVIQSALRKMTGEEISLIGASRTDAGVHALSQVAHFATGSAISCKRFVTGLNSLLPDDIAIADATEMLEGFHSRKCAKEKIYLYRILLSGQKQPLALNRFWRIGYKLDIGAMKKAARHFIGEKDFASFRAAGCASRHAIREIKKIKIARKKTEFGCDNSPVIDIEFHGSGFLRHMIRNIVGTLVEAGCGRVAPSAIPRILAARDRKKAGVCAPACGLYLVRVIF